MNFFTLAGMILVTLGLMAFGGFMFSKLTPNGVIAVGCIIGFAFGMGLIERVVKSKETVN